MRPQTRRKTRASAASKETTQAICQPAEPSSRQRSKRAARGSDACSSVLSLPIEVVQVIGSKLALQDLRSCRLVCKQWAERISQGVETVELAMHPAQDVAARRLRCTRRLMPMASHIRLHISNRQPQKEADYYFKELQSLKHLRSLQLLFRGPPGADPKVPVLNPSTLLRNLKSAFAIAQLRSLTIQDHTVAVGELLALSSLKNLTMLAFTSQDNFKAASVDAWRASLVEPDLPGALTADAMRVICCLKSLRHLEVPLSRAAAHSFSTWDLSHLSRLTCLITHGHTLRVSCLDDQTAANGMDTCGDAGVQQHDCLLKMLPELKELSIPLPRTSVGSAWGLDADAVVSSALQNLALTVTSLDDVLSDLTYVAKLKQKLRKLVLKCASLDAQEAAQLTQLQPLQHLEVHLSGSVSPFSQVLSALTSAIHLRTCVCTRPLTSSPAKDPGLHASLAMLAGVADSLQTLALEGVLDADFEPVTAHVLRRFNKLKVLSLKCADNTQCKLPVNLGLLPGGLEQLHLRFAQLQGLSARSVSLPSLQQLTLVNCATDNMRHFTGVLNSLPALTGLHLENLTGLTDEHISSLGALTGLTSLAVMAVSNHNVTNAALGALSMLTDLRKLMWHVGDMLDATPEVVTLKAFSKLLVLSLTTSMFYRLSRWGALDVLSFLPHCQLETVGP